MTQLDDNKIVGGQEAKPHAYPWQVALTYYDYQVIDILGRKWPNKNNSNKYLHEKSGLIIHLLL